MNIPLTNASLLRGSESSKAAEWASFLKVEAQPTKGGANTPAFQLK